MLLGWSLTGAAPTTEPRYTVRRLVGPGQARVRAVALNDRGDVAGTVNQPGSLLHRACIWRGGEKLVVLGGIKGFPDAQPMAINNLGEVAGRADALDRDIIPVPAAFVYRDGKVIRVKPPPGYKYGGANSINDAGEIVGFCFPDIGRYSEARAFLYSKGRSQALGTLGGSTSFASDINSKGQIVGYSEIRKGDATRHAVLFERGRLRDLGTLGGTLGGMGSAAAAINAAGQIAGWAELPGGETHACLWVRGRITDLGTIGSHRFSESSDINAAGHVVGRSYDMDMLLEPSDFLGRDPEDIRRRLLEGRAFLWRDGRMHDLNDLLPPNSGWALYGANSINRRGQIVAEGAFRGRVAPCVLTPAR